MRGIRDEAYREQHRSCDQLSESIFSMIQHSDIPKYFVEENIAGKTVIVRAIRPDDKMALRAVLKHLSPDSMYMRFLTAKSSLSDSEVAYFTEVDFVKHVALIVEIIINGKPTPIAVGQYIRDIGDPLTAEVALIVDEDYQGQRIGTLLLTHLIKLARAAGVKSFYGLALAENTKLRRLLEHIGLPTTISVDDEGLMTITLPIGSELPQKMITSVKWA